MTEKLDYYDIIGTVIPGILLVSWVAICFPSISQVTCSPGLSGAFGLIAGIALAIFVGQFVQAIGSLIEPVLYWSWGGRLSEKALEEGLGRYLPTDTGHRIREKLRDKVGQNTNSQSLFLYAMQLTDAANIGRAARFNGLYAYHRSQVVLVLAALVLAAVSSALGRLASWHWGYAALLVLGLLLVLVLAWHRAKQRAKYYVREVLLAAEKIMDERDVK